MGDEYRRFWIASSVESLRELLLAEGFEGGAEGAEEQEGAAGEALPYRAWLYARAAVIDAIRERLQGIVAEWEDGASARIGESEVMPVVDWSEAWKAGLGPIEISERLVVRPPFSAFTLAPGQREIVIEPKQAFGTGTHASTHLCLEWVDRLLGDGDPTSRPARVLDVGTGSGILALAAVALGAEFALGFDLDPIAIEAAEEAAAENGLSARVALVCAPIEEIDPGPTGFDLILANLLKRELLPIAPAIAERLAPGGSLVLAGLLEEDAAEVAARFAPLGLCEVERRVRDDSVGRWIAPRLVRSSTASGTVSGKA